MGPHTPDWTDYTHRRRLQHAPHAPGYCGLSLYARIQLASFLPLAALTRLHFSRHRSAGFPLMDALFLRATLVGPRFFHCCTAPWVSTSFICATYCHLYMVLGSPPDGPPLCARSRAQFRLRATHYHCGHLHISLDSLLTLVRLPPRLLPFADSFAVLLRGTPRMLRVYLVCTRFKLAQLGFWDSPRVLNMGKLSDTAPVCSAPSRLAACLTQFSLLIAPTPHGFCLSAPYRAAAIARLACGFALSRLFWTHFLRRRAHKHVLASYRALPLDQGLAPALSFRWTSSRTFLDADLWTDHHCVNRAPARAACAADLAMRRTRVLCHWHFLGLCIALARTLRP